MSGKQMFSLSLIILSIVMGLHWFKNKPKIRKKNRERPKVALKLDDLQLQDSGEVSDNPDVIPDDNKPTPQNLDNATEQTAKPIDQQNTPNENATASDATQIATLDPGISELPPELNDPIIIALKSLPRNPFEISPYAKLVEKLRELENQPKEVEIKKTTSLLQANFTATIKTPKELVAVIDSRLYRKGDDFQDKKITDISTELVKLDTPTTLFLIPKVGVEVKIAPDGTYTFEDTYKKSR